MSKAQVANWDVHTVGQWLDEHSFSMYKSEFIHHGITGEILLELTYDALKDIGVQKIGDRARILQTIKKEFRTNPNQSATSHTKASSESLTLASQPSAHASSASNSPLTFKAPDAILTNIMGSAFSPPINQRSPALSNNEIYVSSPRSGGLSASNKSAPLENEVYNEYFANPRSDTRQNTSSLFNRRKVSDTQSTNQRKPKVSEPAPSLVITPRSSSMRPSQADTNSPSPKQVSPVSPISQLISLGFIDEARRKDKSDDLSGMGKAIRVKGTGNQTFIIDANDANTPERVRDLIFQRFGILDFNDQRGYVLLAIDSAKSEVVKIDDEELMKIVNLPTHPYKANLTLRKQYIYPESGQKPRPALQKLDTSRKDHNQENSARGLSSSRHERSYHKLAKFFGEPAPPSSSNPSSPLTARMANKQKSKESVAKSPKSNKLASFFGERPPDALIAHKLEQFFPEISNFKTAESPLQSSEHLDEVLKNLSVDDSGGGAAGQHTSFHSDSSFKSVIQAAMMKRLSKAGNRRSSVFEMLGRRRTTLKGGSFQLPQQPLSSKHHSAIGDMQSSAQSHAFSPPQSSRLSALDESINSSQDSMNNRNSVKVYKEVIQHITQEEKMERKSMVMRPISTVKAQSVSQENLNLSTHTTETDRVPITRWTQGQLIGQGAFGKVFHGLNLDTGEIMAVKQVMVGSANDPQRKKRQDALRREMELLEEMDHPNIVKYLGYEITDTTFNVFLEYVSGGSVASCLLKFGKFQEELAQSMTCQILCGMEYLHEKSIIHRDIKAANIDPEGVAKISDFGISKKNEYQMAYQRVTRMSMQGSIYWMAPEVAQGKGYSAKVDMWSLGCLVVEMLTGRQPWYGVKGNIMYLLGNGESPPIPGDISDVAKDFLAKCFSVNPDTRPTATELLDHPFADVNPLEFDFKGWFDAAIATKAQQDAERESSSDYSLDSEESEVTSDDASPLAINLVNESEFASSPSDC